jgi:DNA-binding transcriptional LysR family regulator
MAYITQGYIMNKTEQQLSRIDLNLLIALSVLLKERSVTKAAEVLYISQPAMSRTLQRLRELFDDPLFIRVSHGLVPTVKGEILANKLPLLIKDIKQLIQDETFEAKLCKQAFSISVPAITSHALVLPFINYITEQAPHIQISELAADREPFTGLENADYDFSIHILKSPDPHFTSHKITSVSTAIFAAKHHPLLQQENTTIEQCLAYKFVDLALNNEKNIPHNMPIDQILREKQLERSILLRSAQLSTLTDMLKKSDTLLAGPDLLMHSEDWAEHFSPVYIFNQQPEHVTDVYLIEHQRIALSEAHQWFKNAFLNYHKALSFDDNQ